MATNTPGAPMGRGLFALRSQAGLTLVEVMVANMGGAEVVDIDAGHDVAAEAPEALAGSLDELARS